jgi:hypothetical protein
MASGRHGYAERADVIFARVRVYFKLDQTRLRAPLSPGVEERQRLRPWHGACLSVGTGERPLVATEHFDLLLTPLGC